MNNKLIMAGAGAGKTTFLVNEALKLSDKKILITTFTISNAEEIKKKFYQINGGIPKNVTILTWFSFLLQHGIRPYLSYFQECEIRGIEMVGGISEKYTSSELISYYLNSRKRIYSDKIAEFAYKINKKSDGLIIKRITRIFSHIFIDEIQDLVGYDLEFIILLLNSVCSILMVGDLRQCAYQTCSTRKNNNYVGKIKEFLEQEYNSKRKYKHKVSIDDETLNCSYRNNKEICELANQLYDYPPCISKNFLRTGHDGIFWVTKDNLHEYINKYKPVQLRYDIRNTKILKGYEVYNFGESKGLSFDRVIIYPTQNMLEWLLKDEKPELSLQNKAKLYVAITRAKYSVAIYCEKEDYNVSNILYYISDR